MSTNQTRTRRACRRRKVIGSGVQWRKKIDRTDDEDKDGQPRNRRGDGSRASSPRTNGPYWKSSNSQRIERHHASRTCVERVQVMSPSSPQQSYSWRSPFSNRSTGTKKRVKGKKKKATDTPVHLRVEATSLMGKIPEELKQRGGARSSSGRRIYDPHPSTHIFDERLDRKRGPLDMSVFSRDSRIEGNEVIAPWTRRAVVSRRE